MNCAMCKVAAFLREMQCSDWWTSLYKSLYTGTIDLSPSMTRSGPLRAPWSCNDTLAIQSFQRITSLLGQPQNYQYKACQVLSRTRTADYQHLGVS